MFLEYEGGNNQGTYGIELVLEQVQQIKVIVLLLLVYHLV
jgi:hypothetical protein